jgi:hypothetical protein
MSSSDESASNAASSPSDPSTTHHTQRSESTKVSLTHHETKAVNRSKLLVYAALFVATACVGVSSYFLAHNQEVENFETQV